MFTVVHSVTIGHTWPYLNVRARFAPSAGMIRERSTGRSAGSSLIWCDDPLTSLAHCDVMRVGFSLEDEIAFGEVDHLALHDCERVEPIFLESKPPIRNVLTRRRIRDYEN